MLYNNIDNIPMYIFDKIISTGELELLGKHNDLYGVWCAIFDEYTEVNGGLSDQYKDIARIKLEIIEHYYNAYINNERHDLTLAEMKEIEIAEISEGYVDSDYFRTIAQISKLIGFRLDPMTITAREFINYKKLAADVK